MTIEKELEEMSWVLAGVCTAVQGYLKPEESYAGMPIPQIEEAVRLRMALALACEALKPFYSTAREKNVTHNELMCEFLKNAEKRIEEIRKVIIPTGRARF